ncbi:family 43 glycosylhydrolase [Ferruginibacter sp.]
MRFLKLRVFIAVILLTFSARAQSGYPKLMLPGDYADPSIIRDGKDYYMTHSPFFYTPGYLIWHSTDLLHWEPVARAMTGPAQGLPMAPDLVKYKDTFYIYFPSAKTNWVIWATNIKGPWSEPVDLKVAKIDPGHAVGEDGKRYLFVSGGGMVPLTANGLAAATSDIKHVYDGWDYPKEWITECKCLESPKIIKRGEYFYMVTAEGGTAGPPTSHMAIAARSKSILGPWENSPYNPIVHTYTANEHWWSKGHGTLIDDVNGNWWMVYHAYENGYHTLGRQTLIEPIEWTSDGWFKATERPIKELSPSKLKKSGFDLSDDLTNNTLGLQWTYWKKYDSFAVHPAAKGLSIKGKGNSPADGQLLLCTAQDTSYQVDVTVQATGNSRGGLILFYNEKAFTGILADKKKITVYDTARTETQIEMMNNGKWILRIKNERNKCSFYASKDGKQWTLLRKDINVSALNHNNYRNFLALRIGLLVTGEGNATFNRFVYKKLSSH